MIDLAEGRIGAAELLRLLPRPRRRLRVLPCPPVPSLANRVSTSSVVELLNRARREFDVVVVDGTGLMDDPVLSIIERADRNLYACTANRHAIRNAKLALDTYRLLRLDMDRFALVGVETAGERWRDEYSAALEMAPLTVIPFERRLDGLSPHEVDVVIDALPDSEAARVLLQLAEA
jgi:Flp pilus assembly CpaE family ATPase